MTERDSFTVYLPSNSPGTENMIKSESPEELSQSYFKSTLDSPITLEGDSWQVGLAEVCIPADMVSILGDVTVGACIVNPPKQYIREVRKEFIAKLTDDRKSHSVEYEFNKGEQELDTIWITYGKAADNFDITIEQDNDFFEGNEVMFVEDGRYQYLDYVATEKDGKTVAYNAFDDLVDEHPGHGDPCEGQEMRSTSDYYGCENETLSGPTPSIATAVPKHQPESVAAAVKMWREKLSKLQHSDELISSMRNHILPNVHRPAKASIDIEKLLDYYWKKSTNQGPEQYNLKADIFVKAFGATWFRRKPMEIALGKRIRVEHDAYPNLGTIQKGFYKSRSELVSIINERLRLIMARRSYPNIEWNGFWFEPLFHADDSGIVVVKTGFFEPLNGLNSTSFVHVVPTLNSYRALKMLGMDIHKWKWNKEYATFVYDVYSGSHVVRRDNDAPIRMLRVPSGKDLRIFAREKLHIRKIVNQFEKELVDHERKQLQTQMIAEWFPSDSHLSTPSRNLPNLLYVYLDIASPVNIGNTKASVVRIVSLKHRGFLFAKTESNAVKLLTPRGTLPSTSHETSEVSALSYVAIGPENNGQNEPERFTHIIYSPVARKSISSVTVFLTDEYGSVLHFYGGSSYVVLQFKRDV